MYKCPPGGWPFGDPRERVVSGHGGIPSRGPGCFQIHRAMPRKLRLMLFQADRSRYAFGRGRVWEDPNHPCPPPNFPWHRGCRSLRACCWSQRRRSGPWPGAPTTWPHDQGSNFIRPPCHAVGYGTPAAVNAAGARRSPVNARGRLPSTVSATPCPPTICLSPSLPIGSVRVATLPLRRPARAGQVDRRQSLDCLGRGAA